MWYSAESKDKPILVDDTSSEMYVYIRKDIKEVRKEEETFYSYLEQKIKKDDWELYKTVAENTKSIEENSDAILETYEANVETTETVAELENAILEVYELIIGESEETE